jgi:hypothetical protein
MSEVTDVKDDIIERFWCCARFYDDDARISFLLSWIKADDLLEGVEHVESLPPRSPEPQT